MHKAVLDEAGEEVEVQAMRLENRSVRQPRWSSNYSLFQKTSH